MAKVGTERIFHKGSGKEIYSDIKFYTKTKLFIAVDIPDEIKSWYGSKSAKERGEIGGNPQEIVGKSYDECVKKAREIFTQYYDQDISEEQIIAYKIQINNDKKREMFHSPEMGIGIEYHILYRIKIGDETFISTGSYEESKNPDEGIRFGGHKMSSEKYRSGYSDYHKIPYTKETHAFFNQVSNSLLSMIEKVDSFFGKEASHFLDNLNSGKLIG